MTSPLILTMAVCDQIDSPTNHFIKVKLFNGLRQFHLLTKYSKLQRQLTVSLNLKRIITEDNSSEVSMKISILLVFAFISSSVFAGMTTAPPWKPGKKHRCGFNKFRCPKAGNKCIRRPRKKTCETVKLRGTGKRARVKYVDWCKTKGQGYACPTAGSYSNCSMSNGITYSASPEVNPYAACAP